MCDTQTPQRGAVFGMFKASCNPRAVQWPRSCGAGSREQEGSARLDSSGQRQSRANVRVESTREFTKQQSPSNRYSVSRAGCLVSDAIAAGFIRLLLSSTPPTRESSSFCSGEEGLVAACFLKDAL